MWQHESDMDGSPFLRVVRTVVLAAACVLLAVFGHLLTSSALLPQTAAAQAWCAVFAVGYPLTGRERTLPAIASFVITTQVVLHLWFTAAQVPRSSAQCLTMANLPPGLTVPGMCGSAVPTWAVNSLMLVVYLACALACAWWIRRGEAAYYSVGRIIRLLIAYSHALLMVAVASLHRFVPFRRPQPPRPVDHDRPTHASDGARLPVVRRGPPTRSRCVFA